MKVKQFMAYTVKEAIWPIIAIAMIGMIGVAYLFASGHLYSALGVSGVFAGWALWLGFRK